MTSTSSTPGVRPGEHRMVRVSGRAVCKACSTRWPCRAKHEEIAKDATKKEASK